MITVMRSFVAAAYKPYTIFCRVSRRRILGYTNVSIQAVREKGGQVSVFSLSGKGGQRGRKAYESIRCLLL